MATLDCRCQRLEGTVGLIEIKQKEELSSSKKIKISLSLEGPSRGYGHPYPQGGCSFYGEIQLLDEGWLVVIYFFIYSFNKYLLSSCNVPGIIPVRYSKRHAIADLTKELRV